MHMISVGYLALTRMSDNAVALREAPQLRRTVLRTPQDHPRLTTTLFRSV